MINFNRNRQILFWWLCGIFALVWTRCLGLLIHTNESLVRTGPSIFSDDDYAELVGASTPAVYYNKYMPFLDRCSWSPPVALYNASLKMRVQKSRHAHYSEYMYDVCHDPLCLKYQNRFPFRATVSFCGAPNSNVHDNYLVTRIGPFEILPQRLVSWSSFMFMTPTAQAFLTGYFFGIRHTHAPHAVILHHGDSWSPGSAVASMMGSKTSQFLQSGNKLHVPNSVPDSVCPDGPLEPCLFKSFPAGYGQVKSPSFDLEALARVDNLVDTSVKVSVEVGTRWIPCNVIREVTNVFYLQFHIVKDDGNAFLMPETLAPSIRWVSYELPSRGCFVPPPELHTHPNSPSTVWLLQGTPASSLPREVLQSSPQGDLAVMLNETVETLETATYSTGHVMCRIRSSSLQQGDRYDSRRALYDNSCNLKLTQWQFLKGEHLTIIAFNRVVSHAFMNHQDVKLFTFFHDVDSQL